MSFRGSPVVASSLTSKSSSDLLLGDSASAHNLPRRSLREARNLLWLVCWLFGVGITLLFAWTILGSDGRRKLWGDAAHDRHAYQLVANSSLPDYAAAIMVTDRRGRSKWTVSIPLGLDFPLRPAQYADICSGSMRIAQAVRDLKGHTVDSDHYQGHPGYYDVDPYFMDVAEAKEHGLLPVSDACVGRGCNLNAPGRRDNQHEEGIGIENGAINQDMQRVCEKSLTYVMETSDAGLGSTLMGLWMSYGLAQKEGRAFFIDDSNW